MKVTLEPTSKIVDVNGVRCRIWQGHTERGVPIHAHIALVGVARDQDASELDAALREVSAPRAEGERRHEYDHFRGYDADHQLDVESACTSCHGARRKARGENQRYG